MGELEPCEEFPAEVIQATTKVEDLWSMAKWAQYAVKGVVRNAQGAGDEALKACLEEVVGPKHLRGPFSRDQVTTRLGTSVWLPTPRFCIQQGEASRAIDDASHFQQNATVTRTFKLTLGVWTSL